MNLPTSTVNAIEFAGIVISIYDVIRVLLACAVGFAAALGFLCFLFRHQIRLFRNLKKELLFVNLTGDHNALEMEADLLTKGRLLSSPRVISDDRIIDNTDLAKYSLLVLGVNQDTDGTRFRNVYTKITALKKPVLIYTLGNRNVPFLHQEDYIKTYSQHAIVTTPIRLVGDIFTILSTFP